MQSDQVDSDISRIAHPTKTAWFKIRFGPNCNVDKMLKLEPTQSWALISAATQSSQARGRTIFLVALLVVMAQFSIFYAIFLVIIPFLGLSFFYYSTLTTLVQFAINPVLLFYLFYRLGKHVTLSERYLPVLINVFVGGTIGAVVPQLVLPIVLQGSSGYFSGDFLSLITTLIDEAVTFVEVGVGTMFVAFTAIALANIRGATRPPQPAQTTEQVSQSQSPPADNVTDLVRPHQNRCTSAPPYRA